MPQHHTEKERRQARYIQRSEKKAGRDERDAERIAWATVNKHHGHSHGSKHTPTSRHH